MMYLGHFGLERTPFSITPDAGFFFPHARMQQVVNTLLVALRTGEGFVKVVGEVGCGKTVLCRRLLDLLQHEAVCAYVPNPELEPHELYRSLCDEFGIACDAHSSLYDLKKALTQTLLHHAEAGRRVVVCIDEAQAMPLRTLESLRLISNIETQQRKLLQIVLLGQPELDLKLRNAGVRQLLQRIGFSEQLMRLGHADVARYVQHRLLVAGTRQALFTPRALRGLSLASHGVPRLVNVLAHKALLLCYGEGRHTVGARHVRAAARDTPAARVPGRSAGWSLWLTRPVARLFTGKQIA